MLLVSFVGVRRERGARLVLAALVAGIGGWFSVIPFADSIGAEAPPLATTATSTPLLAAPAADAAVLREVSAGVDVELSGSAATDFVEVSFAGETGWVRASDVSISNRVRVSLAEAGTDAPILAAPMREAAALGSVPRGGVVILTGANVGPFVAASYEGTGGWIAEDALGLPFDADSPAS